MSIVLTIVKSPENILITENTKTIGEQGGTLGRGDNNTWVLQDPDRFLSSIHCQINVDFGQYTLVDMSTNGTFINKLPEPIGRGNRIDLKDGDVFDLGDYEFRVSLSGLDITPGEAQAYGDPFANNNSRKPLEFDLAGKSDPLGVLDNSRHCAELEINNDLLFESSSGDAISDSVHWPRAYPESGVIPGDWNDVIDSVLKKREPPIQSHVQEKNEPDLFSETITPNDFVTTEHADINKYESRNKVLEEINRKLQDELKDLKQQLKTLEENTGQGKKVADSSKDRGLVQALGLGDKELNDLQIAEINQISGELLRETVGGMLQVLGSRANIKNEFRMNVTTIQPIENNPLKFSANIDDALENMFIKKGDSFIKPVQAFKEGFQSIEEHQAAIMTGMRFAYKGIMDRFDPVVLEKRFEKQNKRGFIARQKVRNWSSYFEYYNDLVADIDKSFQYLFGDDFVHAYEEQLSKLYIKNKSQIHNSEKFDCKGM